MIGYGLAVVGTLCALASLPGTLELLLLTLGAAFPVRRRGKTAALPSTTFRLAVVIPAHNEAEQIGIPVASLARAEHAGIEVVTVVVADNCTDRTADEAAKAGARVLTRFNDEMRGKGYALDFAFQTLQPEGYDGYLVIDADSEVARNTLTEVVAMLRDGADAVQCRYMVRNPGQSVRTRLMNVALMAFNVLRPRGRDRWGLSAGINGNGFALSAETLRRVSYGAASLVEDLEYHLDLVRVGRKVRFADAAAVYGEMPVSGKGVKTQRTRWEGGRFRMLSERAPSLAIEVLRGKISLLEPLADLLLLPLAFHVTLLLIALIPSDGPSRFLGLAGLAVLAIHLPMAIYVGGGGMREAGALATAPFYVLWKLLMLPAVLRSSRGKAIWVRTERSHEEDPR